MRERRLLLMQRRKKKLLRKLDIRIIPMICWIYLMNFMDRGMADLWPAILSC